jgi:hypothetical protein
MLFRSGGVPEQTFKENGLTVKPRQRNFSGMKFVAAAFICILFGRLAGHAQNAITPDGARELFNGKDFSGWTFYLRSNAPPEKTWSITNGMVHCTGRPAGYMRTEQTYQDFKVTVEWRFPKTATKPVNTGVLVFMPDRAPDASPKQVWPHCVECQGMHDHMGDFWLQGGTRCMEAVNMGKNGIKMLEPSNESPVGEWTTFSCICRTNTVEIVVNGKSMNKITGVDVSAGYIGI